MSRLFTIVLLSVLLCGLSSCCKELEKDCERSGVYQDFFDHTAPETMTFKEGPINTLILYKTDTREYGATSYTYCEKDEEPHCDSEGHYRYEGTFEDEDFVLEFTFSNAYTRRMILVQTYQDEQRQLEAQFFPLDLGDKPDDYLLSILGLHPIGTTHYPNVFRCLFLGEGMFKEVYWSRKEGLMQLVLEYEGEMRYLQRF